MSQCETHTLGMTSYDSYTSSTTLEKGFNAYTPHLGETPIFALYGVLGELAQRLLS